MDNTMDFLSFYFLIYVICPNFVTGVGLYTLTGVAAHELNTNLKIKFKINFPTAGVEH